MRVLHTPGHRPEHCAHYLSTRSCCSPVTRSSSATQPDRTTHRGRGRRRGPLPQPAAARRARRRGRVSGSRSGLAVRRVDELDPSSTIGNERRSNMALRIDAVDDFVADALSKNAPRPPNMEVIVALNRGPFLEALPPSPRRRRARRDRTRRARRRVGRRAPAGRAQRAALGRLLRHQVGVRPRRQAVVVHARSMTLRRRTPRRAPRRRPAGARGSSSTRPAARNDSNLSTSTSSSCSCSRTPCPAGRAGGRRARRGLHRGLATHPYRLLRGLRRPRRPDRRHVAAPAPERESPPASLQRAGSTRDPCSTAASKTATRWAATRSSFAAAARKLRHDVIGERPGATLRTAWSDVRSIRTPSLARPGSALAAVSRECRWVRPRRSSTWRREPPRWRSSSHAEPAAPSSDSTRATRCSPPVVSASNAHDSQSECGSSTAMPSGCRSRTASSMR